MEEEKVCPGCCHKTKERSEKEYKDLLWMLFFMRMNLIAWVRFSALVLKEICIIIGIALPLQEELDAYKRLASYMQSYYEALKKIDLDRFKKETSEYNQWVSCMGRVENEQQLNIVLRKTMIDLNIQLLRNVHLPLITASLK